jgi:hypothetical protein
VRRLALLWLGVLREREGGRARKGSMGRRWSAFEGWVDVRKWLTQP